MPPSRPAAGPDALCSNCGAALTGPFCSRCGQKVRVPLLAAWPWLRSVTADLASFDYRAVPTLRALLFRPGVLTLEYFAGRRQGFTPPLRLYLVVSAVAIALMSLSGMVQLDAILQSSSPDGVERLAAIFGVDDLHDPAVQERFNTRFNTIFPLLNLVTPVGLCLALKLVAPRVLLHGHAVFALHLASAQVLYSMLLVPAVLLGDGWVLATVMALIVGVSVYAFVALRRVYGGSVAVVLLRLIGILIAYFAVANLINLATLYLVMVSL